MIQRLTLFLSMIALAACAGFEPLHATSGGQAVFSDIQVVVGDGETESDRAAGYIIQQHLADRMSSSAKPTYRLMIEPTVGRLPLGLTGLDFASRFDGVVTANWVLQSAEDGSRILSGRTSTTATYSAIQDPYRLQSTSDAATDRAARELADALLNELAVDLEDHLSQ